MRKTNIILTGFMGTGKSTLGRLLAKRLGYEFIDTDTEIEKRIGQTIAELFQEQGEGVFRQYEAELVQELAQQQGLVIATGGGLVLNPKNVKALSVNGKIVCLTASPADILGRISKQQNIRPLLQESDPQAKVIELLDQRASVYSQFQQLSTSGRHPDDLLAELLEITQSA
ncbi:MAG: shikimate kinase [Deltaproteobacteria bacterium]|nr:shikimate kinase [Deltaproteobacteria bacterium]